MNYFRAGEDGVVPLRTNLMVVDVERCHRVIRHLLTGVVGGCDEMGLHLQPCLGGGLPEIVEHQIERA